MNKHVLMIAAALMLGTLSFAQGAGPKGGAPGASAGQVKGQAKGQGKGGMMMRGQGMADMEKKVFVQLNLNAGQKTKVANLQKARMDNMKAMREKMKADAGAKPDRTKMGAAFKKMSDDYQAGLKSTLTPAQYKKYGELMKAEMDKFAKEHPRTGGKAGAGGVGKPGGKKPPL